MGPSRAHSKGDKNNNSEMYKFGFSFLKWFYDKFMRSNTQNDFKLTQS